MRLGVVAGESSGDMLGAGVLAALRLRFPNIVIEGIGGPQMEAQGLRSLYPMERLSVMGFIDPLKRLPELLRIRRALYEHFSADPPDIFLGIDAPDFNLFLERRLRQCGVNTAHLVSPSVWAWRPGRIHKIKHAVDLMLCLFPFEVPIYRQHHVPVCFVGHPMADEIPQQVDPQPARQALALDATAPTLALLPGSRSAEIRLLAPRFLQAARLLRRDFPGLVLVLPAAGPERETQLRALLDDYRDLDVTLVSGRAREVMAASDAVLLASGTATLEAALLKRPMVVAYRMGAISWFLLRRLVTTPHAALPNILVGGPLVPELLQGDATAANLAQSVGSLLADRAAAKAQVLGFEGIHDNLRRGFGERCAQALAGLLAQRTVAGG